MSPVVLIVILTAIAPAAFMLYFVYARDKYEKEPVRLILKIYFLSFLSVIPAILLELPLFLILPVIGAYVGFVIGFIEEGVKYLFLRWLAFRNLEFNEPFDGIIYAVAVSLGFATLENLGYILRAFFTHQFLLSTIVYRGVLTVPLHALMAVVMGSYIGRAKFTENAIDRRTLLRRGVVFPSIIHGVFDFFIYSASDRQLVPLAGAVAIVILSWILASDMIRHAQEASPFRKPASPQEP